MANEAEFCTYKQCEATKKIGIADGLFVIRDANRGSARVMKKAFESLIHLVGTVLGGISLTLVTILAVEFVNKRYFEIPQPSALYMIAVAAAALIGGLRSGLISALIVIAFSAYVVHTASNPPFVYDHDHTARLVLFAIGAPLMAIIVGLLRRRNDDLLREHMLRRHTEETAKAEFDRERHIAVTLQNAIMTPILDRQFANLDIGYCYEAAWAEAEVGGDFYDFFALDARTVAIVLGDISGKGLAAATKTAEIKYTLRAFLHKIFTQGSEGLTSTSAQTLAEVNKYLVRSEALPDHDHLTASFEVATFACLILGIVRTDTGAVDLAVAAMEPPMIIRRNDCVKFGHTTEILDVGGLPLGVAPNAEFRSMQVHLEPGDTLLFATDGITESRQSESLEMFGLSGLQLAAETALAIGATKPETLTSSASRIVSAAKAFSGRGSLNDDACVIVLQVNGSELTHDERII